MGKVGKGCLGCFSVIGIGFVLLVIIVLAFSKNDKPTKHNTQTTSSSTTVITDKSSASQKEVDVKQNFNPTDTSDATIESIVTYADYLDMYELIVNEYITNYEAAIKQYGIGDTSAYQIMRDEVTRSVEEQKKEYGPLKKAKIVGKADLVQFLKDYRDQLKTYTDSIANGFEGLENE